MPIREHAIPANKRFLKRTEDLFKIYSEMEFERLFGDVKYDVETSDSNLIIESEGLVFYADVDESPDDVVFSIVKRCPECGEIYMESFSSLPVLGARLEDMDDCECGGVLELLPTKNAMKEIEDGQKVEDGYIVNGNNCKECGQNHN